MGPRHQAPLFDNKPIIQTIAIAAVQDSLKHIQNNISNLKKGNEAEIVWAQDTPIQTDYCFVYLPGFGASKAEGEPIHRQLAARYGMNLYLARLEKQGVLEKEPFLELSEEKLVHSAKEAIRFGKSLGKKVILLTCSTGSTLGFYLAANDADIAAIVAWSPNVDMADPMSAMLTGPWGLQLARLFLGGKYRSFEANDSVQQYWIHRYRIEGLVCLKSLIQQCMTKEVFEAIKQPVMMAFHYKNDKEKDHVISIEKGQFAFDQLGTETAQKRLHLLDKVSGHCMASKYYSNEQQLQQVRQTSIRFLEDIVGLEALNVSSRFPQE